MCQWKNYFNYRCGEVTEVRNSEKGYAFVTMADEASGEAAIKEMNGTIFEGQKIKVEKAFPKGDRKSTSRWGNRDGGAKEKKSIPTVRFAHMF